MIVNKNIRSVVAWPSPISSDETEFATGIIPNFSLIDLSRLIHFSIPSFASAALIDRPLA